MKGCGQKKGIIKIMNTKPRCSFRLGCKKNILRNFSNLKTKLTIVPADTNFNKISELKPDGVFLSNGPGTLLPHQNLRIKL